MFSRIKLSGKQDGVVMKINPNCNAVYGVATWVARKMMQPLCWRCTRAATTYNVAGGTFSDGLFSQPSPGVIQSTRAGQADGYIAVISNDGSQLVRGTYLGTTSMDIIYGIQFDRNGFPYIMGVSRGGWWVINANFKNDGSKQFVSKLEPDLSAFVYSTVFGSGAPKPNISPVAFLVDRCENVYVSGWGGWIQPGDDPYDLALTTGMPVTPTP